MVRMIFMKIDSFFDGDRKVPCFPQLPPNLNIGFLHELDHGRPRQQFSSPLPMMIDRMDHKRFPNGMEQPAQKGHVLVLTNLGGNTLPVESGSEPLCLEFPHFPFVALHVKHPRLH